MMRYLRRLIKPAWRRPYHRALAWLAAWRFSFPARRLTVIGITGTDGKTSTAILTAAALGGGGDKVGLSSTVNFQVGDKKWLNETHMTMPGRFALPALMKQMVDAGCKYAVIEISSEGLAQGRLRGIEVDVAVLTNVSPEHIESHGSFEKYRAAKKMLFTGLANHQKKIQGQAVPKVMVVNGDDKEADFFLDAKADRKIASSLAATLPGLDETIEIIQAADIEATHDGSTFRVGHDTFRVRLPGRYNVANALQAVAVAKALGLPTAAIQAGLATVEEIPGRFETVDAGQGREVVIDYAVTPAAMKQLFQNIRQRGAKKIIAVFGATGGGRDKWKRPELGQVAATMVDQIILTTEDPFDEDPNQIATEIKKGIPATVATEIVLDRREAIKRALSMAQPGDVIALTGMGSETTMNVAGGKKVEWNDKHVVEKIVGGE